MASSASLPSYQSVLRTICREQGELSDEGNAIVDKHSGYVIMMLESATEEGSEFRGMLLGDEEDVAAVGLGAAATSVKTTVPKKYDNPRAIMISNVVTSMGNYLSVDLNPLREFIVEKTMATLNVALTSEEAYNRKAQAYFEKEKKRLQPYKDFMHNSLLFCTLAFLTVAIQTAIPSLKTNKTQPGCVRSFIGYPLLGEEDMSGIRYVACIAHQLKSKSVDPWSAIKDLKENTLAERIKTYVNMYVITQGEIGDRLALKREYLKEHVEDLVPVELDIRRMTTFLPPLSGVVNPVPNQVSPQFMERLDDNLRRGKPEQTEQIGVLRAKVMYFSLGMQQLVQEVVSKFRRTDLLLKPQTEGGVPFLQNACCLEGVDSTTLQYFVRQRPGIHEYNADAAKTQAALDRIVQLARAGTYYDPKSTKPAFPPLSPQFDERTIYMAFTAFCNYDNLRPVPPQLQLFCLNKPAPDEYAASDSLTAKIEKLKRRGVNFTREAFAQMMQVIGAENIVHMNLNQPEWSNDQQLRDLIAELHAKVGSESSVSSNRIVPAELQAHILGLMDTYDQALSEETPEMREFKSYLSNLCDDRWARIGAFLDSNRAGVPHFARQRAKLTATFGAMMEFAPQKRGAAIESDDATAGRAIQFTKNCMHSLADVFPGMICNEVTRDAASVKVPAHWGLSNVHRDDVRNIIGRTYAGLNKFYGDRQLAPLLKAMQSNVRDLMRLMSITPFFAEIRIQTSKESKESKESKTFSVFDGRIVHLLYKYYFLELLAEYTRMVDYEGVLIEETVPVEEDALIAGTLRADEAATGVMEEVQILQVERTVVSKTIVQLLFAYADIVDDERAAVDMNADTIKERVRRTKDKEKELIVEGFDAMTKEQRETEKFFKDHRIGDWNVGMQKGLRQYVKDTYDREREEMEEQLRKERQLSRRDFVSDMQREIFLDGDADRAEAEADAEEFSLRGLPVDDDYGDADDGGALDYEDVNES